MTNWATAKDFFEAQRPVEVVEVPGLGSIKILGLTAGEKDEYEDRVMNLDVVGQSMTMNNATVARRSNGSGTCLLPWPSAALISLLLEILPVGGADIGSVAFRPQLNLDGIWEFATDPERAGEAPSQELQPRAL